MSLIDNRQFTADAEEIVARPAAEVLSTASASAIVAALVEAASAEELSGSADAGAVVPGASLPSVYAPFPGAMTFEEARAEAQGSDEEFFIDGLHQLALDRVQVPWGALSPCFRSIADLIGMEPAVAQSNARLKVILLRLSHYLQREPHRWGRKSPARASTSFIAVVREKLDAFPVGTRIPRHGNGGRASWAGLAVMLEMDRNKLAQNVQARAEVMARLADGRLVLGQPYLDRSGWSKDKTKGRRRLFKVLAKYADPANDLYLPLSGPKLSVDMDWLLDEAGVTDSVVREALKRDTQVRREMNRIAQARAPRHVAEAAVWGAPVTFAAVEASGRQAARERYRSKHPSGLPDSDKEQRYVANELVHLRRAMRENLWTPDMDAETELLGKGAAERIKKGGTGSLGGDRNYFRSMERWVCVAAGLGDARKGELTFGQRVLAGIRRQGLTVSKFAGRCGMQYETLQKWSRDMSLPTFMQMHLVHRIEDELGYARDHLGGMLGTLRTGRNNSDRKQVTLEDGRVLQLRKYLKFLPAGALSWPEDRLRAIVTEVDSTHFGAQTVNTVRMKAALSSAKALGPLNKSAQIFREWRDLELFKTTLNDPRRAQNPKWEWGSKHTVKNNRSHVENFARWAMSSKEDGGLGLLPDQVSFVLFFNHQVIQKYVAYRVKRFAHCTLEGEELGPMLTATEAGFLGLVKSVLDPEYGWLTQSRDAVASPRVIDVTFSLERLSSVDKEFTVLDPDEADDCTVMDEDLVQFINHDWYRAAREARLRVNGLLGKVEKHYRMVRDPHALVMPILIHDSPVAVVVRMVIEALKRAPSLERAPVQHALEYRNAVAMLLLVTVVFRSETLRDMIYRSDGSGHLIRTAEGFDVKVGRENFKNGFCTWLFGPTWRRRDYQRALGSWGSLNAILDYYLKTCRPILLNGRDSDLLFPTGQTAPKWTHKTFNTMITNWTRTWSVKNHRHDTGMEGVLPWGPHCIRDIVATHIIANYDSEQRWELASAILGTGVELVKKRYAYVNARKELAKADPLYEKAFDKAFSNEKLY